MSMHSRVANPGNGHPRTSKRRHLTGYPYLEQEDILAAIEYAAHQTDHAVLRSA